MNGEQHHNSEEWRSHLYFQAPLRKQNGDIRLLTIQSRQYAASMPEGLSNATHCFMRLANVKDDPEFRAVSHRWDADEPADEARSVLVNGARVPVSTRLFEVLDQLQQDAEPTTVWIDALSINQADVEEKSAQVAQVADVYGKATKTFIWLGPAADGSDEAVDVLVRVANEYLAQNSRIARWTPPIGKRLVQGVMANVPSAVTRTPGTDSRSVSSNGEHSDLVKRLDALREPVKALMERPYWSSLWSVSEVTLSPKADVACGSRRMELDQFEMASNSLDTLMNQSVVSKWLSSAGTPTSPGEPAVLDSSEPSKLSQSPALRMLAHRAYFRKDMGAWIAKGERPLQSVLNYFHVQNSAEHNLLDVPDPRDRVYALLGLSSDAAALGISPEYSKGYKEMCADFSAALLRISPRPLQLCQGIGSADGGSPSWVVDWSSVNIPLSDAASDRPFMACGPADERFYRADTSTPGQVSLKGAIVDSVGDIGEVYLAADDVGQMEHCQSYLSEVRDLWGKSLASDSSPYSTEQTMVALAKVPVGDTEVVSGQTRRAATAALKGYNNALEAMSEGKPDDLSEGADEDQKGDAPDAPVAAPATGASEYLAAMARMHSRRPFISTTGYIGLGPSNLEAGDTIIILYGSRVPFALRRQADDTYQLVGEAYVFGIMDGEFMKVHRDETVLRLA